MEGGAGAHHVDGHCFYHTYNGKGYPGWRDWEGDCIGMLLDLDQLQGSMTVWKNDVKLGVMVAEGLRGPLCWAVSLVHSSSGACIESASAPAPAR